MSIGLSTSTSANTMAFPTPAEIPNTSLPLPDPEAYEGEPREYARALMQRKDELEHEIVSKTPHSSPLRRSCINFLR